MGWWQVQKGEVQIIQGDGPFDTMGNALDAIVFEYQQDWGRNPTLPEVLFTIQSVLGAQMGKYVDGGDTLELIEIAAKTKLRPKRIRYKVGDYFVIPLPEKRFAYGRILTDINALIGPVATIFWTMSQNRILPLQVLDDATFMFPPFFCSVIGWETGRWPIIGSKTEELEQYDRLEFKMGDNKIGWKILSQGKSRPVSPEETQGLEFAILYSVASVEHRILEAISAENLNL